VRCGENEERERGGSWWRLEFTTGWACLCPGPRPVKGGRGVAATEGQREREKEREREREREKSILLFTLLSAIFSRERRE
jgi:hypothetical protein